VTKKSGEGVVGNCGSKIRKNKIHLLHTEQGSTASGFGVGGFLGVSAPQQKIETQAKESKLKITQRTRADVGKKTGPGHKNNNSNSGYLGRVVKKSVSVNQPKDNEGQHGERTQQGFPIRQGCRGKDSHFAPQSDHREGGSSAIGQTYYKTPFSEKNRMKVNKSRAGPPRDDNRPRQ